MKTDPLSLGHGVHIKTHPYLLAHGVFMKTQPHFFGLWSYHNPRLIRL